MAGGCCHDPCRDSPTGWTCGSSSSSTWRFSCLSTCCPEGAAQGHCHQGNSHPFRTLGTQAMEKNAFVRDEQLGTRLRLSLDGGGTFSYCVAIDLCVSQVLLFRFYLYPAPVS
ncbi:PREDICTED: uncharacterized protein LOC102104313 [Pseudopodoces humilis]|uniref:uncharacterized protein LOC102104313 n=1 Tax=Pseudopodoces humilis TaxID=181119 RepID=UPI000395ADD7|nr:PREDICTED: uncharacterized protein LOC102104313 [Pseudopodoces humilis]